MLRVRRPSLVTAEAIQSGCRQSRNCKINPEIWAISDVLHGSIRLLMIPFPCQPLILTPFSPCATFFVLSVGEIFHEDAGATRTVRNQIPINNSSIIYQYLNDQNHRIVLDASLHSGHRTRLSFLDALAERISL